MRELKTIALFHLKNEGRVMRVNHSGEPISIFNNPALYPSMFPWLFPYGKGGVGNADKTVRISEAYRIQCLLLYHDKRFQTDPAFSLVAFNHMQIKKSTQSGFLLSSSARFSKTVERISRVDTRVLEEICDRFTRGERVVPTSTEEKECFKVLDDLNHMGSFVPGSHGTKRDMKRELWSLVSYVGAPSWFITFTPSDLNHPLALYMADNEQRFEIKLRTAEDKRSLIGHNAVACARFFNFIVSAFIKYILRWETSGIGLFGKTGAFYGTVEQQGLIWKAVSRVNYSLALLMRGMISLRI
ncbi:hypothetical protein SISNIDRAFT_476482 [Sistotremastrum niveocremeum HHB9708]|uniref:Helitron helicase-like domain-containing protein n=1 Tax=Sistotremastrum niveocremeum HHB9708 TaxID=1314777 RepID=A0A164M4Z1_9AGAM|nr:hypothetical protein SISNIDRAFT_476482 [Sistotremastrum niveocremeum HHB9708]